MEQVKVDAIGAQTAQRPFAGSDRSCPGRIVWQHFGDQEHRSPPPRDRFAHQAFGRAIGIHLGRVDQAKAQIETSLKGMDFVRACGGPLPHSPRPKTEAWDLHARSKRNSGHTGSVLGRGRRAMGRTADDATARRRRWSSLLGLSVRTDRSGSCTPSCRRRRSSSRDRQT